MYGQQLDIGQLSNGWSQLAINGKVEQKEILSVSCHTYLSSCKEIKLKKTSKFLWLINRNSPSLIGATCPLVLRAMSPIYILWKKLMAKIL